MTQYQISVRERTARIGSMVLAASVVFWLLPVLAALSAGAKLPKEAKTEEFDVETGLVPYGFSTRDRRSAYIDPIRFESKY